MSVLIKIKRKIQKLYYYITQKYKSLWEYFFIVDIPNYKDIPIIINNRNRYSFMLKLIASLQKRGYNNIFIIDNDSTYPPLIKYYNEICPFTIFKLNKNYGHLAIWKSGIYKKFNKSYYVYTDPDLEIIDECPDDFMLYFLNTLKKNKMVQKIGFALKFDDLPEYFEKREDVINWEKRFYDNKYNEELYIAHVDTTFALYRPKATGGSHDFKLNLRTIFPYMMSHLPWYLDTKKLPEEELYYIRHAKTSTFWTGK